ncbi:MAG: hypothetical protein QGF20_15050 [Alphaproteobacteria bacterium]|nr:hypothetical protein [Alphaproteobacteria bacterium]
MADEGLVTAMYAIEVTNGHRATAQVIGGFTNMTDDMHGRDYWG